MTTFKWKTKVGAKVSKRSLEIFANHDSEDSNSNSAVSYGDGVKRLRKLLDVDEESQKLLNEGAILAEAEKYWEAIRKWNEAIRLTPDNEKLYEMKAQVLMQLNEHFQAVQEAEKAVALNPRWWVGYQTLGRAQIGIGELKLALINFSKAIHINPAEDELWKDDLALALKHLGQMKSMGKDITHVKFAMKISK